MKRSNFELLRCPACQSSLAWRHEPEKAVVEAADLVCVGCERSYFVKDGIVHLMDMSDLGGPNKRFARFYDRFAPFYTLLTRVGFLPFGGERRAREEVLTRLELQKGRLLEVSIGPGVNLPFLFATGRVGEVFGLDISGGQLKRCRQLVMKRQWDVELFQGTAERLPFPDNTFDNVFHIGGINFFTDKARAIGEMIRVARPGSKIVIADESERLAQLFHRMTREGRSQAAAPIETAVRHVVPRQLIPNTMQEVRIHDIWQAHERAHGYCLTFRKPGAR